MTLDGTRCDARARRTRACAMRTSPDRRRPHREHSGGGGDGARSRRARAPRSRRGIADVRRCTGTPRAGACRPAVQRPRRLRAQAGRARQRPRLAADHGRRAAALRLRVRRRSRPRQAAADGGGGRRGPPISPSSPPTIRVRRIRWRSSPRPSPGCGAAEWQASRLSRAAARGYVVEPDRARAIAAAIAAAAPGDCVVIAGKGHEDYQIVGTVKLPFDDRLVARAALTERPA